MTSEIITITSNKPFDEFALYRDEIGPVTGLSIFTDGTYKKTFLNGSEIQGKLPESYLIAIQNHLQKKRYFLFRSRCRSV